MKVHILRGVSGSGKSTIANGGIRVANRVICSADDFDGLYRNGFNPSLLPQAHAACLKKFVSALQFDVDHIVVDNTNTTVAEVAPYAALALAYDASLMITTVKCNDLEAAFARNVHGVPLQGIKAQALRLALSAEHMPPWWPQETVESQY